MRSEFERYQDSIKEFNERTRLGFESFIQSHGSDRNKLQLRCTPFTDKKCGYGSFDLDFGLAVWQHRQTEVDELQKRVDAVKQLIQEYRDPPTEDKTFCHALSIVAYELEQALKGGDHE